MATASASFMPSPSMDGEPTLRDGRQALLPATQRLRLSARAIADLAGVGVIAASYLAEALQYRPRVE